MERTVTDMDYLTKPVTRSQLRELSQIFRQMFSVPLTGRFPVLDVLERFHEKFPGSYYVIIEDEDMPATIPARCKVLENGAFEIQLRRSTYDGAYKHQAGAFRDHIVHEMSHAFLYSIGFTPTMERRFKNGRICCYCSSEWQAKALCGEIMMPYEETKGLSSHEIAENYGVSQAQAKYRCSHY